MIERVRALLRKAADPAVTDEESQAFTAKAAELMTRHSIAEAEARSDAGREPEGVGMIEHTIIGVGGHGKSRATAMAAVARAYGCMVALRGNTAGSHDRTLLVVGTASALGAVELLLASLGLQMEQAARREAERHMRPLREWGALPKHMLAGERARFYRSFLRAYGHAVAERIAAMRGRIAEEGRAGGEGGAEVVLARDSERVRAEFGRRFPRLGKGHAERTHSTAGYRAGYASGSRADLGMGTVERDRSSALPG
ncbi:MAG: DUF2786 domain-containing protein [Streptosporangiales bacterium]|nr:DUF2786 domain-containing protein [Streptosporangiales bacterium]